MGQALRLRFRRRNAQGSLESARACPGCHRRAQRRYLGVEADVRFRLRLTAGQSYHRGGSTGGAGTLAQEARLEYRLVLPCFHPERSDYQWTLRLLREGDNPATGETGEVAARGNLIAPSVPSTTIDDAKRAREMDYQIEHGTPTVNIRVPHFPTRTPYR